MVCWSSSWTLHYHASNSLGICTIIIPIFLNKIGDLHDQEGHLRNAAGQRIDTQGAAIPEPDEAVQPKTLADYNRSDQFYTNISAISPPTIQRDYELKA